MTSLDDPPAVRLVKRALKRGLTEPKAWRVEGGWWLVSGFNTDGRLRLWHARLDGKWEELTVEEVEK